MATKRSRTAFEDDAAHSNSGSSKDSPYALFGTPLPPLDSHVRDDGSYVPVWQQEVRDERGRKRLHGAFTGGFSAGYFNTVGSKEGWTPQTFVSSRTNRAKAQQKAEDFMDEEDIADAEDAKRLHTAAGYGGLGCHGEGHNPELFADDALVEDMRPSTHESMGAKLLQRMGWRQGQGVGPKVRRKARVADDEDNAATDDSHEHLFAPENSKMISFIRKSDFKGLGYAGEASLRRALEGSKANHEDGGGDDDREGDAAWNRVKPKKLKPKKIKPSFGVGVLNDTGSDDDDPYELGPQISYNKTIGGDKKEKKKKPVGGANPLLASRPVFMSKKSATGKPISGFRKCHDGRLPLDGFLLAMQALDISPTNKYPPPKIPDAWKAKRSRWDVTPAAEYQSTADIAKASTLDPKARAAALGEATLPGKSVFDYISPTARDRLAAASGRNDLPQGRGEDAPEGYRVTEEAKQKQLWSAVPDLSRQIALEALQRGASGWMPYADDESKRARYRAFLELKAGVGSDNALPQRAAGASTEDWKNEMSEFAQAAEVFRPITGAMASRFTTASRTYEGTHQSKISIGHDDDATQHLSIPHVAAQTKPEDPAEAAAKIGMYGLMTRSMLPFYPTRLLCKRFNVRPPKNVHLDPDSEEGSKAASSVPEMVPRKAIERMMQDAAVRRFASGGFEGGSSGARQQQEKLDESTLEDPAPKREVVDVERNEALEAERPGDAVFKAIFGSDDEDDD